MSYRFLVNLDDVAPTNLSHSIRAFNRDLPDITEIPCPPRPSDPGAYLYAAQDQRLHDHNYQRIESVADGSSFFRSTSYDLYGSQKYHPYVRKVAVDHMFTNRSYYFPNWDDVSVDCYLHFKSQTSPPDDKRISADERAIQATADAFRVKMVRLFDSGDVIRYTLPRDGIFKQEIHLCHIQDHTDSMLPSNVVPPEPPRHLDIAREASIKLTGYFCREDLTRIPRMETDEEMHM